MKRIITLLLAATMVLGAVAQASAVEVQVKGTFDFAFGWRDGTTFGSNGLDADDANEDDFISRSRVRTQVEFIASEALKGVVQFEIGTLNWGRSTGVAGRSTGADLDTDGVNIETRHAYVQWMVPQTQLTLTMGLQHIALPSFVFGNPVFSSDVAGVVGSYKFTDNVALTAFWARPYDTAETLNSGNTFDAMDMFGVMLPLTFENVNVTPWFVYSSIGGNTTYYRAVNGNAGTWGTQGDMYVGGVALAFDIADFGINFDGMYGSLTSDNNGFETDGYLLAASVNYNGFDWGKPGVFGWYASGSNYQEDHAGMLPVLATDSADGFTPTSFGYAGSYSIGDDSIVSTSGVGTWGIGAQIADLTFIQDLSHTIRVAYYSGTNDDDFVHRRANAGFAARTNATRGAFTGQQVYMITEDSAIEVNLDSQYKIYDNLTMLVELGYVHMNMAHEDIRNINDDNAWKAQLLFRYEF